MARGIILASRAAFLGLFALLSLAMLTPPETTGVPGRLTPWDKADHALAFYALTLTGLTGFARAPHHWFCLALLGFAGATEILQGFTTREADIVDFIADGLGIALAALPKSAKRFIRSGRSVS